MLFFAKSFFKFNKILLYIGILFSYKYNVTYNKFKSSFLINPIIIIELKKYHKFLKIFQFQYLVFLIKHEYFDNKNTFKTLKISII